jgi:hypothetical protein
MIGSSETPVVEMLEAVADRDRRSRSGTTSSARPGAVKIGESEGAGEPIPRECVRPRRDTR